MSVNILSKMIIQDKKNYFVIYVLFLFACVVKLDFLGICDDVFLNLYFVSLDKLS